MQRINQDIGIGHNIKRIRKRLNLRQVDVVAKMQLLGCKITRSTYVKIERETHNLKVSDLLALKVIFNVDFNEFFADLPMQKPIERHQ